MQFLKNVRYPGRFIVMGMDGDAVVAIYGVTGRSTASQARRYVQKGDTITVMPTDEALLAAGNRDLLVYPAFRFFDEGYVVANGNQINAVTNNLAHDLAGVLPEPDQYHTPRITGMRYGGSLTLHIAREGGNEHWDVPLTPGKGKLLMTYLGDDLTPTAFKGDPLDVDFTFGTAARAAREVYDLLAPPTPSAPDYRVAVIAVYQKPGAAPDVSIINRDPS